MSKIKSIAISEAKPKLTQLVEDVNACGEPYLIVTASKVKAVLIGIDRYNDLIERLEDITDTVELLQAQIDNEPMISFEEHLAKIKN